MTNTSKFVTNLVRFNTMYRMKVSGTPTLDLDTPVASRLKHLKSILAKELDEIDEIILKAEAHDSGVLYEPPYDGEPSMPLGQSAFANKEDFDAALRENRIDLLVDIADLMGDLQVYCGSEMLKFGLPIDEVLSTIMDSNFSKMGADGLPIFDTRGKLQKGPNYWKPEPKIRATIAAQYF